MQDRPVALAGAAAAQAIEAAGLCFACVLAAVDTARGQSYQLGSGIALSVIGFLTVAALAWLAVGLARAQPWSRTPVLLCQLFTGIVGIYLVQGHRVAWGAPAIVLAVLTMVLVLLPPSLHALNRPPSGSSSG